MYKLSILTLLSLLLAIPLSGQDFIEIKGGKFRLPALNTDYQRLGFLGKNVEPILAEKPLVYHTFKQYKRAEIITISGGAVSVVGMTAFAAGFASSDDNKEWLVAFGSVSLLTGLTTILTAGIISKNRFRKSIRLYNNPDGLGFHRQSAPTITAHIQYANGGIGIVFGF